MSGNMKIKSLSLSRKTQTPPRKEESANLMINEETHAQTSNLDSLLNSPIARSSRLSSTPIQKNVEFMEDSPDQDYQASPSSMFPCTQESNEVAWDWQSGTNGADRNNMILNQTPKRRQQFLHKKRLPQSGSPLLNLNSKRKLSNLNNAENIGEFAAELKAVTEKINAVRSCKENNDVENGGETANEIAATSGSNGLGIYDMETQKEFDIHEAETLEVSIIAEIKNDEEKHNSSLDDLFDELNDECMIQCSQEVENKLKISLDKSNGELLKEKEKKDKSREFKIDCAKASSSYVIRDKICDENIKNGTEMETNVRDLKLMDRNNSGDAKSGAKLSIKKVASTSRFSDMDDFFDDDDELLTNFLEKSNAVNFNKEPPSSSIFNSEVISVQNNQALDVSSNFKRKQQCLGYDKSPSTSQSRKFFKAKSLSDSSCMNSNSRQQDVKSSTNVYPKYGKANAVQTPISKSTSNCNLSTKNRGNEIKSKVYSIPNLNNSISAAGGRTSFNNKQAGCSTVSYSYLRTSNENLAVNKFNEGKSDTYSSNEGEKALKELRTTIPTISQQQRCTDEEIEKKRIEAKMRLERNRLKKLQMKRPVVVNNNNNNKNNNNIRR